MPPHTGTGESSPLLGEPTNRLAASDTRNLYLSHFLSTWNARVYEFAAILFTASAYPSTLKASSIRGIATTLATLTLSSSVGRWCDRHPSRLQTLRVTIFVQRVCVVLACLGWSRIVGDEFLGGGFLAMGRETDMEKAAVMAAVIVLGVGERLSAVGNMMVMERDWVPTLATVESLPQLNAVMRRIDLLCKLAAPVFISAVAVGSASVRFTILSIAVMSAISVVVEWIAARNVWLRCAELQVPKHAPTPDAKARDWVRGLRLFFAGEIAIPSLALALLYFSVLSFSASMITYLLSAGFTLSVITLARTASTVIEVSSTVIMPLFVASLEKRAHGPAAGVERTGLWGLWWMALNLIPVSLLLYRLPTNTSTTAAPPPVLTVALFTFLALSRLGLWTYDLCVQTLVQTYVVAERRGEFSGVEMGFVSAVELLQWVVTAIWSGTGEFKGIAAAGNLVVMVAAVGYTGWVWRKRGHLVHWEKLRCGGGA